jgi:hypothetical protein
MFVANNDFKVNVLFEGGIGDFLCANRFMPAVLEKYPAASIKLFSNTNGGNAQAELVTRLFPSFYQRGWEHVERADSEFRISSQFGREKYPSHIDNLTTESKSKIHDCDLFLNFHIDSLEWLHFNDRFEVNTLKYFKNFPAPQTHIHNNFELNEDYILIHFYSRPDSPYLMEEWYVEKLINKLSEILPVAIISDENSCKFYNELKIDANRVEIFNCSLDDCFALSGSKHCKLFFGIDSGIRYIPLHYDKPTFAFSKYAKSAGKATIHHLIRWLINDEYALPIHHPIQEVENMTRNIIRHPAYKLYPYLPNNIENFIVERKIKADTAENQTNDF